MSRRNVLQWMMGLLVLAAGSLVAMSVGGPLTPVMAHWVMSHWMMGHSALSRASPSVQSTAPVVPIQESFASTIGTAFSIGPGLLVTNAHVTLRCAVDQLPVSVAGYRGTWRVAWEDHDLDLALLRGPDSPTIPALALSVMTHVPRDTGSLALGYPVSDRIPYLVAPYAAQGTVRQATIMVHRPETGHAESFRATDQTGRSTDPTWRDGAAFFGISSSARMRWALEIAVTMGHGASGGPVVDNAGSVLGVVVADGTGKGLTSAITLADLTSFLAAAGIVPRFAAPMDHGGVDWSKVYRQVAPSVVRIGCDTTPAERPSAAPSLLH
jgi:hypothetical protein